MVMVVGAFSIVVAYHLINLFFLGIVDNWWNYKEDLIMAKGTVNKVILLGRLGQDPEINITAGGTQVANINIATNELGPKDQSGGRQDKTEWHRVTVFGKTAEVASKYLRKGSLAYFEGRLQTRKWQDQAGQDRYTTEIVAYEMQLVGGRNDNPAPQQQGGYQQPPQEGFVGQPQQTPQSQPQGRGFDEFDDDIPF